MRIAFSSRNHLSILLIPLFAAACRDSTAHRATEFTSAVPPSGTYAVFSTDGDGLGHSVVGEDSTEIKFTGINDGYHPPTPDRVERLDRSANHYAIASGGGRCMIYRAETVTCADPLCYTWVELDCTSGRELASGTIHNHGIECPIHPGKHHAAQWNSVHSGVDDSK